MGGDFAPQSQIDGAIEARAELPADVVIVLVGDEKIIRSKFEEKGASLDGFEIVATTEVIGMGEHPTRALRQKPNSSITVGVSLLKDGKLDCFASAGNSGAMMVGAMYSIRSIPGVIRPSITSILPKESGGDGLILDVGINADVKPDVLYQFAILGSLFAEHVMGIENPRVGLLNIGEEKEKGNLLTIATHRMMTDTTDFNFVGNIEGRDLFEDKCDVIVCDGFTGNVVLKEAEAFYKLIAKRGMLDDYFSRFNYELYGGTPILGVNGNVIIGHGISSPKAVKNMLKLSMEMVEADIPEKVKFAFRYK